jgi:RNA polymerase sigma-70 factor (ECF subfamily)
MLATSNHQESENLSSVYGEITAQTLEIPVKAEDGKRKQFEEMFIPLLDSLYNMALRMTRNPEDAEDLVQETYLKAYRFFDKFRENSNPRGWIMTVMLNAFRTRYRKASKEPTKVDYDTVENFISSDNHAQPARPAGKSEGYDPEKIAEYLRSVLSDDMIKALDSLPVRFRVPVLLSDAEQFNYQEISQILDINIGTVKSRIFRGRRLLRKNLLEYAVDRGIYRRR